MIVKDTVLIYQVSYILLCFETFTDLMNAISICGKLMQIQGPIEFSFSGNSIL